jgi:hypothetical protein
MGAPMSGIKHKHAPEMGLVNQRLLERSVLIAILCCMPHFIHFLQLLLTNLKTKPKLSRNKVRYHHTHTIIFWDDGISVQLVLSKILM